MPKQDKNLDKGIDKGVMSGRESGEIQDFDRYEHQVVTYTYGSGNCMFLLLNSGSELPYD